MPRYSRGTSAHANKNMIAALLSIQAMGHLEGLGTALFVLLILSALVECFFGYVLFRLVLMPRDQPLARSKRAKGRKRSRGSSRIGPRFTRY